MMTLACYVKGVAENFVWWGNSMGIFAKVITVGIENIGF